MSKSFSARLCTMGAGIAAATVLLGSLAACGGQGSGPAFVPVGAPTAAALATGPGTVPSTAAAPASSAPSTPASAGTATTGSASTQPPTLKEQIAALERSGGYPKLDRSSDIVGPDANKNGVRDDIEAWINAQGATDAQRKALMQEARALQATLIVDIKDKAALDRSGDQLMASSNCGSRHFSPYEVFSKLAGKIEAMTANTRERAMRYIQYNAASSGSATTLPDGNTCEQ